MPGTETTMALRQEPPGDEGWERSARAGNPNKYFGVSVDCHANEPKGWAGCSVSSCSWVTQPCA